MWSYLNLQYVFIFSYISQSVYGVRTFGSPAYYGVKYGGRYYGGHGFSGYGGFSRNAGYAGKDHGNSIYGGSKGFGGFRKPGSYAYYGGGGR